jgi:hypothetical protein
MSRHEGKLMSSLARRSLRTTAAVAGIAAASVGLAGPATAAPAEPERPGTDGAAPAPADSGSPNLAGDLPPAPEAAELPMLFTFEGPSVYTADQGLAELPTADQLPTVGDAVSTDDAGQVVDSDVTYQASAPRDQDGAMSGLDTASTFGDLTGPVLGATADNDVQA